MFLLLPLLELAAAIAGCKDTCQCVAPELVCLEGDSALGAVLVGESAYQQKYGACLAVTRYSDFHDRLGVELGHLDDRWDFRVSNVTDTSYKATIRGLDGGPAEGILGVLTWSRHGGAHILWDGCDPRFDAPQPVSCAEGQGGLGAILTGESVYRQLKGTFVNVATAQGFVDTLHVDLSDPSVGWAFQVTDATDSGFVGVARGLAGGRFEGAVARLVYRVGQEPVTTCDHTR